jgi:hypothetical protein
MRKKAKSGRKKRSVTWRKSQDQTCAAWLLEIGRPRLASWLMGANRPHVLLDGALAHPKAQFQQFPADPFSAPKPIFSRHLSDQGNRFRGDLRLVRDGL